jgi:hypothetical protein
MLGQRAAAVILNLFDILFTFIRRFFFISSTFIILKISALRHRSIIQIIFK